MLISLQRDPHHVVHHYHMHGHDLILVWYYDDDHFRAYQHRHCYCDYVAADDDVDCDVNDDFYYDLVCYEMKLERIFYQEFNSMKIRKNKLQKVQVTFDYCETQIWVMNFETHTHIGHDHHGNSSHKEYFRLTHLTDKTRNSFEKLFKIKKFSVNEKTS